MTWISVKKRLPQVNEVVIGYTNRGRMVFVWVDGGTLEFDEQDIGDNHEPEEKFTHWRYKPKRPRIKIPKTKRIDDDH